MVAFKIFPGAKVSGECQYDGVGSVHLDKDQVLILDQLSKINFINKISQNKLIINGFIIYYYYFTPN